ncbi:hypothetical protein ACI1US_02101 [Leucobacter sp. BZR 635]
MNATDSLTNAQRAEGFAAAVRSHLSDLPADELDDLLDGLGADLTERLNDGDELGDAASYAEELRQAAGLPQRAPGNAPRVTFAERIEAVQHRAALWFDATPGRRGFRDFAVSVRPLWWVLRAVIGAWAALLVFNHPLVNGFPISFWSLVFTLALIVLSVQWGRGKWLPRPWVGVLRTIANVAAVVLLLPFLFSSWANATSPSVDYIYEDYSAQGIVWNGEQVTNIFAYDCEGNPLDSVRLYDQRGNPLTTLGEDATEPPESWDENDAFGIEHDFNPLAKDAAAWNVFPLSEARANQTTGEIGKMEPATPPSGYFPPLSRDCAAVATTDTDAKTDAAADPEAKADAATKADAEAEAKADAESEQKADAKAADAP